MGPRPHFCMVLLTIYPLLCRKSISFAYFMQFIPILVRFSALAITFSFFGCTKGFDVKNIDKIEEYYISRPYFNFTLDYPVKLTITGKIDGRARIYLTPSATVYNSNYSIPFGPNDRRKTIVWQVPVTMKKAIIIYKPTTAKKGELNVKVNFQ